MTEQTRTVFTVDDDPSFPKPIERLLLVENDRDTCTLMQTLRADDGFDIDPDKPTAGRADVTSSGIEAGLAS